MERELTRRGLLASGGSLFAGSAVASVAGAAAVGSAADPPPLRWSETYDGATTDTVQDALRTDDGNYVVVGQSGRAPTASDRGRSLSTSAAAPGGSAAPTPTTPPGSTRSSRPTTAATSSRGTAVDRRPDRSRCSSS
ncbi:hypothetical protein ACFQL4_21290 [Halosimplex aquaticum]